MDASAFITRQEWESLLEKLDLTEESICEGRYNQVLHMVGSLTDVDVIWHYKFACFRYRQRMEPRTFTALRTTLHVSKVWSWLASGRSGSAVRREPVMERQVAATEVAAEYQQECPLLDALPR